MFFSPDIPYLQTQVHSHFVQNVAFSTFCLRGGSFSPTKPLLTGLKHIRKRMCNIIIVKKFMVSNIKSRGGPISDDSL